MYEPVEVVSRIAATARVHQTEVWTQDDDFTDFAGAVTLIRL